MIGGGGDDFLTGGEGDDTFVFTNDSSSIGDKDTIRDFGGHRYGTERGDNTIQLSGFTGVDDFGDLKGRIITTGGSEGDIVIDLRDVGGGQIVLEGVVQVDADDFDFG